MIDDKFLSWIRTYDVVRNGPRDLVKAIWNEWQWRDYIRWYPKTRTLKISTGGWSEHEEIMAALQENTMFWLLYWKASVRGGHYTFHMREIE